MRPQITLMTLMLVMAQSVTSVWSEEPKLSEEITNSIGMKLVRVPAGEFMMGNHESPETLATAFRTIRQPRIDELADEKPVHKVQITRPFYMGAHEVTIAQYKQFVENARYQTEPERDGTGGWGYNPDIKSFEGRKLQYSWRNTGFRQAEDHPVVNVTWGDCVAFCEWLSKKESRRYRLPTEAEWEYACRAGTTTRYHSGDDPEALVKVAALYDATTARLFPQWQPQAVNASDGYEFTAPVGRLQPNDFGLFDMHGNVWEWCADWYAEDYYSKSPVKDPRGPEIGKVRVRRGGSWQTWPFYMRSSFRNWNTPETRYVLLGFRVVCEAERGKP